MDGELGVRGADDGLVFGGEVGEEGRAEGGALGGGDVDVPEGEGEGGFLAAHDDDVWLVVVRNGGRWGGWMGGMWWLKGFIEREMVWRCVCVCV